MADPENRVKVTLEELMVSTLAMTDALSKALDRKGSHHRRGVYRLISSGAV